MSRSASEATRFTATAPNAYSKSSPASRDAARDARRTAARSAGSTAPSSPRAPSGGGNGPPSQGPPGETPQERVARLRAAYRSKRASEVSRFEKVIIGGRSVADAAHRITVVGLVGLSVIAGAVTIYSFIDLSRYNRTKKREWLEKQYENLQKELVEASRAERQGFATPEQILLLNRERAAEQARRAKEERKGVWTSVKGLFTTEGLRKTDDGETVVLGEEQGNKLLEGHRDEAMSNSLLSSTGPRPVTQALQEHRRQGERALEAQGTRGGLLDQTAASAVEQTKRTAGSWSSWLGFGSK